MLINFWINGDKMHAVGKQIKEMTRDKRNWGRFKRMEKTYKLIKIMIKQTN